LLVSLSLVDYDVLNYVSLTSLAITLFFVLLLPATRRYDPVSAGADNMHINTAKPPVQYTDTLVIHYKSALNNYRRPQVLRWST
jgi:hypothetical protein